MYLTKLQFCDKRKFKRLYMALWYETDKKETSYIDSWLIYTLWYEFSNVFVAHSDFGKKKCHKKSTNLDHSYLKYTLKGRQYTLICTINRTEIPALFFRGDRQEKDAEFSMPCLSAMLVPNGQAFYHFSGSLLQNYQIFCFIRVGP